MMQREIVRFISAGSTPAIPRCIAKGAGRAEMLTLHEISLLSISIYGNDSVL